MYMICLEMSFTKVFNVVLLSNQLSIFYFLYKKVSFWITVSWRKEEVREKDGNSNN